MPMLIDPIDQIARQKQRTVLYVVFDDPDSNDFEASFDWENCKNRQRVITWFDEQAIQYQPCFQVWSDGLLQCPYRGQLYIDVPFETDNSVYKKLEAYFENQDGSMKNPEITFCYLPLKRAMKNAHHDEEGYWDNW